MVLLTSLGIFPPLTSLPDQMRAQLRAKLTSAGDDERSRADFCCPITGLIKLECVANSSGEVLQEQRDRAGKVALLLSFLNVLSDKAFLSRPPKL